MSADDDRSADHTDDPRKQDEGSGGYPETTPGGTDGGADRHREGDTDAPGQSSEDEDDREKTTGNPGAAG